MVKALDVHFAPFFFTTLGAKASFVSTAACRSGYGMVPGS
jgi:hypothetical protein